MNRIAMFGRHRSLANTALPAAAFGIACALGAVLGPAPASAQGKGVQEPSDLLVPGSHWTGLYLGVHAGIAAVTGRTVDSEDTVFNEPEGDIDLNGFAGLGGLQLGVNQQFGNAVFGLESDVAWTSFGMNRRMDDSDSTPYVEANMDWLLTLRGRFGLVAGNSMAYVTAGVAFAHLGHCGNLNGAPCSIDDKDDIRWSGVVPGLAAGMGAEAALNSKWSVKAEYLFVQTEVENQVYATALTRDIDFSNRSHQFRLGLNYHPYAELPVAVAHGGAWSGLYGGLHAGIGAYTGRAMDWGNGVFSGPTGDIDMNEFAGLAGVQIGGNYRMGNIVYGLEGDFAWTGYGMERAFDEGEHYVRAEADWQATLRARMGVTSGNAMAYVTGGLAAMHLSHCANDDGAPCSTDNDDDISWDGTALGLALGAGVEARLNDRWSLKTEYLYIRTDDENLVYAPGPNRDVDFSNRSHQLRLGLNYHLYGLPYEQTESANNWQGYYAGLHAGMGAFSGQAFDWDDDALFDNDGDADLAQLAQFGGVQTGYNHQAGNIVYGIEADLAATNFDVSDTGRLGFDWRSAEMNWLATLRGRLGLASGNAMAYVTGGLAAAHLSHCANDDDPPCSVDGDDGAVWSGVRLGLAAGTGAEVQLTERLSLKGEYLFVQLDKKNVVYDVAKGENIDFSNRSHLFRLGFNYRFVPLFHH